MDAELESGRTWGSATPEFRGPRARIPVVALMEARRMTGPDDLLAPLSLAYRSAGSERRVLT
jgi:hypothetical protein